MCFHVQVIDLKSRETGFKYDFLNNRGQKSVYVIRSVDNESAPALEVGRLGNFL